MNRARSDKTRNRRARIRGGFGETIAGATWYMLLVVALPIISLAMVGLIWSWQSGWLLPLLATWLIVTALAWLAFVYWPRRRLSQAAPLPGETEHPDALPDYLEPRAEWTDRDQAVYADARTLIDADLHGPVTFSWLRSRANDVVAFVATEYKGDKRNTALAFTLPEGLLLVSVVSTRYRELVLSHVPFADRILLSNVFGIAERRTQIELGATWANRLRRGLRLVNPVSAVIGEVRDQFTNHVLSQVGGALKRDLVRLLLQEIAQVAIDLYGGYLNASEHELAGRRSSAAIADDHRRAQALEPLRVVLVGQSSSGKSSLVNALMEELVAETDVLPSTEQLTVHLLPIEGIAPVSLVDTPGLDGSESALAIATEAIEDADLVVWVAKATQPGRDADARLLSAMQDRQAQRRTPPSVLVLSHIDQLPPRTEWSPPYALENVDDNSKAATIIAALAAARQGIGLPPATPSIPARLDAGSYYNVDAVAAALALMAEEAMHTQLNRRRHEHATQSSSWRQRLSQSSRLAIGLGKWLSGRVS